MMKTCPKCGRQFNPSGVHHSQVDPRGWCFFCAQGIPLQPIAGFDNNKPEKKRKS